MTNEWALNGTPVAPGETAQVKLAIGSLPSGNKISILAHVFRSEQEGPTALVLGGVHGDEINGIEIVRRAISGNLFQNLQAGTVIAIPILNVYGFINFSRDVPDGKDVNRSFPGNTAGSLASRVARALSKKVLPLIDFGLDFHTGGRNYFNYPQIRYTPGDEKAKQLAQTFAAPYTLAYKTIPKSLRRTALETGKPILVYEGGESLRYSGHAIDFALSGLQRVLHAKGMLSESQPAQPSVHCKMTKWVRAAQAGLFLWEKSSGQQVKHGEVIGYINDPHGRSSDPVIAAFDGHIIGHNNATVVSQGEALFHVAV